MTEELREIWVYLAASPLLGLTLTLLAYLVGQFLYRLSGQNALCNPVALAVLLLIGILLVTATPYPTYFEGAQFVHFLLGPATVALGVPLYLHAGRIRKLLLPRIRDPLDRSGGMVDKIQAVGRGLNLARSRRRRRLLSWVEGKFESSGRFNFHRLFYFLFGLFHFSWLRSGYPIARRALQLALLAFLMGRWGIPSIPFGGEGGRFHSTGFSAT